MMMKPNEAVTEAAEAVTCVWWDISRCPVPRDVDARRVGPFIRQGLEKLGYSGPLTITAIGILTEVSHDLLREVYSSGIALYHVPTDISNLEGAVLEWTYNTPSPANLMLISGCPTVWTTLNTICRMGYNVVWSIVPYYPPSASTSAGCFLWESILASLRAGAMDSGALQGEDKRIERDDENALICSTCCHAAQDFDSFITHLHSKEHALEELEYYPGGVLAARESRTKDVTTIQRMLRQVREIGNNGEDEE